MGMREVKNKYHLKKIHINKYIYILFMFVKRIALPVRGKLN